MDLSGFVLKWLLPLRPFLALFIFLALIIPLIWGMALTHGVDSELALTFFLPGFFVCFGYYMASNPSLTKK